LLWFDACWRHVVVWLGWCGVVSLCRLKTVIALVSKLDWSVSTV
jgi:uncharacterized protein (DUF983 family)